MSARDDVKARVRAKAEAARALPASERIANTLHATHTNREAQKLLNAFRVEVIVEVLHGAAEVAAEIHKKCDRMVCSRCEVRRDILDVLSSVADAISHTDATKAGEGQ